MQLAALFEIKKFACISNEILDDIEQIHKKLDSSDCTAMKKETENIIMSSLKDHINLLRNYYITSDNIIDNFLSSSLLDSQFELGIMKDTFEVEHMFATVLDHAKMRICEKKLDVNHTITGDYTSIKLDSVKVCIILFATLDLAFYYVAPGSKVKVDVSTLNGGLSLNITISCNPDTPHGTDELLSYGSLYDGPQVFLHTGITIARKYLETFNGNFIISDDSSTDIERPINILVNLYNTR
jgi:hypothetical protein